MFLENFESAKAFDPDSYDSYTVEQTTNFLNKNCKRKKYKPDANDLNYIVNLGFVIINCNNVYITLVRYHDNFLEELIIDFTDVVFELKYKIKNEYNVVETVYHYTRDDAYGFIEALLCFPEVFTINHPIKAQREDCYYECDCKSCKDVKVCSFSDAITEIVDFFKTRYESFEVSESYRYKEKYFSKVS